MDDGVIACTSSDGIELAVSRWSVVDSHTEFRIYAPSIGLIRRREMVLLAPLRKDLDVDREALASRWEKGSPLLDGTPVRADTNAVFVIPAEWASGWLQTLLRAKQPDLAAAKKWVDRILPRKDRTWREGLYWDAQRGRAAGPDLSLEQRIMDLERRVAELEARHVD